jgi:hypothetical protein
MGRRMVNPAEVVQTEGRPRNRGGDAGSTPVLRLQVVPVELVEANSLVAALHRHHQPAVGHRFSLGVIDESGTLHAAAIIGRPVARLGGSPRSVLEVARLVSDGTPNACSMLYAAAARAGKALGFERIQTYILDTETGTTLKAAGWTYEGEAGGGQWKHTDGKPRRTDQPTGIKGRWARDLNPTRPAVVMPDAATSAPDLFGGQW